ncbi:MAG: FAD-dependent oxidoreductase [Anaerolineae bacterium]
MNDSYDVIIVVGCQCARELARYRLRVLLLEKESDVCSGASKANSGIVHPCTAPKPGSWKARLCLTGNRLMPQVCAELGVAYRQNGSLTVALADSEWRVLRALKSRGEANGENGLRLLDGAEARSLEPRLSPEVRGALLAPSAGIVDPFMLTIAAAENAVANGVEVRLEAEVLGVAVESGVVTGVETAGGRISAPYVVNAAGLYADRIAATAGDRRLHITPRRGDYFILDKMDLVQHTIFPIPSPASKGILVTPTAHGNVLLGPTSLPSPHRDFPPVSASGLADVRQQVLRMVPDIDMRQCIAVFAGVRPSGSRDFAIGMAPGVNGLLNLAGIESPGLTAAPAIARTAVALLGQAGLRLEPNPAFDPIRPAPPRLAEMGSEERARLVGRDPRYGRIICRCEGVSEGEIVAAIHAPVPARTLDAIKRRTRAMAGRCQGGFDLPWIVEIVARELGIEPWRVTKNGAGSELLLGLTGDASLLAEARQ